jgi:predicted helicase
MVYQMPKLFPQPGLENLVISATGLGASKSFSAVITDCIPNLHLHDTGQCFPLHYYEEIPRINESVKPEYIRHDAITDAALAAFRKTYADQPRPVIASVAKQSSKSATHSNEGKDWIASPSARNDEQGNHISKEDIFYYVYGILHSPEYKTRFEADLKKQLPRIPYARDFWAFSHAGRELAHWHLNYETVEPYPLGQIGELNLGEYRVQKMAWGKKKENGKTVPDKTTLIYNSRLTLTDIPADALDYIINGKPAIEWIIERYQVTTDKDSGITNDPNDWASEHNDPAYIFNLIKRIIRVSVETVKIVKGLPMLDEISD